MNAIVKIRRMLFSYSSFPWRIVFLLFLLLSPFFASGEEKKMEEEDLEKFLQLEPGELKRIPVFDYTITTASKRPEKLWQTAAAAYVISSTDIQRSAATNVADLLRMVPGLFVGNADSSTWIIGSRGLANEYAVDVLVLIDGRQVNFVNWGGTLWNIQDYPLEDIERIEIIRGPGGTLWGTNSGNGVINIITKHAHDTQGGLISGIVGTDLYKSVFRYGGKMGKDAYYRIYGTYKDVDSFKMANGNNSVDDWSYGKAGFRIDWEPSKQDAVTFQGDVYRDDAWFTWTEKIYPYPDYFPIKDRYIKDKEGIDFQIQWDRRFDDGSQMKWLTYYDYFSLNNDSIAKLNYDVFKTDIQYQFNLFSNHEFILGGGYRMISDDASNNLFVTSGPKSADMQTFTAFFQDNYTIIEDKLKFSLGSHFQYSDFSGFDYQPSAKLAYTPYEQYTIWASITRAAQHYYMRGHDEGGFIFYVMDAPYGTGAIPMLDYYTERSLDSESIVSFEIGQRLQASRYLSFDLAVFYNIIDDYVSVDTDWDHPIFYSDPTPHYKVYAPGGNNIYGETYGAELAANAKITDDWKLMLSYSALDIQLHHRANSNDFVFYSLEDSSPHHQIKVQSYFDIAKNVQLDVSYSFIDEISQWAIPPHSRLDVRLGWKPAEQLELSVVGTNLLDNQTHEADGMYTLYTEFERGVYGKVTYRF